MSNLAPARRRDRIPREAPIDHAAPECRILMWLRGYRPMQIPNGYKFPMDKEWSENARLNPPRCIVEPLSYEHLSTGMLCDGLRVVDVDIEDKDRANQVVTLAEDTLGAAPMRFRDNSHRAALLYRAAEGEPRKVKIVGPVLVAKGPGVPKDVRDAVEVLGFGQQLHVDGLHPSGAELQWDGGSPWETNRNDLPSVTEDQIQAFLGEVAKIIGADPPRPAVINKHTADDKAPRIGEGRLRRLLAWCDPVDRDDWRNVGFAMRDAAVLSDADHAPLPDNVICAMFGQWSSGELWAAAAPDDRLRVCVVGAYQDSDDTEHLWYGPRGTGAKVGLGSIVEMAKAHAARQSQTAPDTIARPDASELFDRVAGSNTGNPVAVDGEWFGLLDELEMPPVEPFVEGLINRREVVVLAGASGSLKTQDALDLAVAAIVGTTWKGQKIHHTGPVLYLALEDLSAIKATRLPEAMGAANLTPEDRARVLANFFAQKWDVTIKFPEDRERILNALTAIEGRCGQCALVVLDTTREALPGSVSDEGDTGPFLACALDIAKAGPVALLVAHITKADEGRALPDRRPKGLGDFVDRVPAVFMKSATLDDKGRGTSEFYVLKAKNYPRYYSIHHTVAPGGVHGVPVQTVVPGHTRPSSAPETPRAQAKRKAEGEEANKMFIVRKALIEMMDHDIYAVQRVSTTAIAGALALFIANQGQEGFSAVSLRTRYLSKIKDGFPYYHDSDKTWRRPYVCTRPTP